MKLQNPFRTALVGTLGVLLALAIGAAVLQLATILTYVIAAAFLALGLDPLVSQLQRPCCSLPTGGGIYQFQAWPQGFSHTPAPHRRRPILVPEGERQG